MIELVRVKMRVEPVRTTGDWVKREKPRQSQRTSSFGTARVVVAPRGVAGGRVVYLGCQRLRSYCIESASTKCGGLRDEFRLKSSRGMGFITSSQNSDAAVE